MDGRSSSGPLGSLLTLPGPAAPCPAAATALVGRSRARGSREGRCWFSGPGPGPLLRSGCGGQGTAEQAGEMLTASARLWSYPRRRLCSVCCIFKQTFPFCFFPLPAGEARWWAWSLERGAWGSLWEGVKLGWVGRRIRLCFCFRSAGGEEGCGGGGLLLPWPPRV